MSSMFCFQCEQTSQGTGCTAFGVCGKDPETAALQDLLVYATEGISMYGHRLAQMGEHDHEADVFVLGALFTTVTNVNFDPQRMQKVLWDAARIKENVKNKYESFCAQKNVAAEKLEGPAAWQPATNLNDLIRQGEAIGIEKRQQNINADALSLQELITYGLKGSAAYAHHAHVLGKEKREIFDFMHEALNFLATNPTDMNALFSMVLKCGEMNLSVLALLDEANTGAYGHPVPTQVRVEPVRGEAILVSGHDLRDMEELLKQTDDKGVNVYTHGEMLPANGYPELKKYKHFVGHYGGAWQDQREDFDNFPGAILMTTNCIQKPKGTYINRIFTSGWVAWPGVTHIGDRNFSPVIDAALAAEGFKEDAPNKTITLGFGHHAVMSVADKVIDAVKQGQIKHFFLIGGCDGAKTGRNYYTEFAQAVPKDCVILTLGCGKYRFNKLEFGDIGGIPRLLDCGQCNDSYSAIQIAIALSKAFHCGVNDLPLSMIISWYEQKAVCVLLTLLYLGIRNIKLGPMLPAFVSPNILNTLVEKFNISGIKTAQEDLQECLAR